MIAPPHAEDPEEQAEAAAEFYPEGFLAEAGPGGSNSDPFDLETAPLEGKPAKSLPTDNKSPEQSEIQPNPAQKGSANQAQALF